MPLIEFAVLQIEACVPVLENLVPSIDIGANFRVVCAKFRILANVSVVLLMAPVDLVSACFEAKENRLCKRVVSSNGTALSRNGTRYGD